MNKLFTKIGTAIVGMAMAVGVGVAVGRNSVQEAKAEVTISSTPVTSITSGTYVVSITDGGKDYYWTFPGQNNNLLKSSHIALTEYGEGKTVTSITGVPEACVVTLTEVTTGKFSISAINHQGNRQWIGSNDSTSLFSSNSAPTSDSSENDKKLLWTFGGTAPSFTITNVNFTSRSLKIYSSGPDLRPYTTQSYSNTFKFYSALVAAGPTFDVSSTQLTFNAGGAAQSITISNVSGFSGTPTFTTSYQYYNGIVTDSLSGNVVTVTPVVSSSIGKYSTDTLKITGTYNTETFTRNISVKVNKQTVSVDNEIVSLVSGGSAKTVTATPNYFSGTPTYSWTEVSDENDILSLSNSDSATVTITPSSTATSGSATIRVTATYQSAAEQSASKDVTVNLIQVKSLYDASFANSLTSDSGTEFTSNSWTTNFDGSDAGLLAASDISKVYPGAYSTIKLGASKAGGSITLTVPGEVEIKRVIVHAKSFTSTGDEPKTDENSVIKVNGTSQSTSAEYKYYVFDLDTASSAITFASYDGEGGRVYVDNIIFVANSAQDAIGAFGYAAQFLNDTAEGCAALNVTSSTWESLSTAWSTMATTYSGSDVYFKAKSASESGDAIQKALARYNFIVGKYKYNDFVFGTQQQGTVNAEGLNSTPAVIMVIAIASATVISIAVGLTFLNKRKKEN